VSYRLTRAAEEDLIAIYEAGARTFGLAQADSYHASLTTAFEFLDQYPRAARERTELSPAIRAHRHQAHLIIYVLQGADVLVVRVRHGHEDWQASPI